MLKRWKVDVVDFGPSLHDSDSCFLIRAYQSLAHRQASLDAFKSNEEWHRGPRDEIFGLIENCTTVVVEMEQTTVDALRKNATSP